MTTSRRAFLQRLGALGGAGAVHAAMTALGLAPTPAYAGAPDLPADFGAGKSVVILGAGIAGLVSAYELEKAGFAVTVLEARGRVGGRNWTLRGGDKVEMIGEETQTVGFSEGVYMNAGPARLPSTHKGILGYCKTLGVPLEVEVNQSHSAYIWSETGGGRPIEMRQAINDARGWLSELLAKAANQGALDEAMTPADKAKMLPFLRMYGALGEDYAYTGSARAGLKQHPGAADQFEVIRDPLPLSTYLDTPTMFGTIFDEDIHQQATMFQPVGGMDQIPKAFEKALKTPVVKNAEVLEIRQPRGKTAVAYRDKITGEVKTVVADYAIVTIPLIVLKDIKSDFPAPVKAAIASCPYDHSNKIGFESQRFWETETNIYGGISWVGGPTSIIWYPSAQMFSEKGMLLACYGSGEVAVDFAKKPLGEQVGIAKGVVEKVHPGQSAKLEHGVVVNWSKIPYNLGPWPAWEGQQNQEGHIDTPEYRLLNQPTGAVYFCGAHLSQTPGWQEGAVYSAHRTLGMIAERVKTSSAAKAA